MLGANYPAQAYPAEGPATGTQPTVPAVLVWKLQRFEIKPRPEETA